MVTLLGLVLWSFAVILLGVIVIVWVILYIRSYDYKIRIREMTGNNVRLIHDTTGKLKKDEDNVHYLKLFRRKGMHDLLPIPDEDAVDYDPKKRKKVVECWYADDAGYVYITDQGKHKGFQPLTTNQRLLMVSQIKKKELKKKTPWTQYLPFIASGMVLVVVLAIVLIFWGEAVQPMIEMGARYESLLDKTDKILEKASLLSGGGQVVGSANPTP